MPEMYSSGAGYFDWVTAPKHVILKVLTKEEMSDAIGSMK